MQSPSQQLLLCVAAVLALLCGSLGVVTVEGRNYAVLISSIKGWENLAYSVQADVCHAYQLLKSTGMTDDDIILMSFGDAAWDSYNTFPGQLYNRAANVSSSNKPVDVNAGCAENIDYIGYEVSPENFLAVITGNHSAVPAGRPVLESGPDDNVFISFEDHGSPGAVYFPDFAPLYSVDVIAALEQMHDTGMYQRLVFYLMACESGSMFAKGMLPPNISIYATAAAAPDVSAFAVYCSPNDLINGQATGGNISNCLASEFGLAWTNETEVVGLAQSLEQQFDNVNHSMTMSTPGQYGDLTWRGMPVGTLFTDYHSTEPAAAREQTSEAEPFGYWDEGVHVNTPAVSMAPGTFKLFLLNNLLEAAQRDNDEAAIQSASALLHAEMSSRQHVDDLFNSFAKRALTTVIGATIDDRSLARLYSSPETPIRHDECMRAVDKAIAASCGGYTDYSRRYAGLVINTCRAAQEGDEYETAGTRLAALMTQLCLRKGDAIKPGPMPIFE